VNEWHNGNLMFGSSPLPIKLQMGLQSPYQRPN
jgi:hypothetical protein